MKQQIYNVPGAMLNTAGIAINKTQTTFVFWARHT